MSSQPYFGAMTTAGIGDDVILRSKDGVCFRVSKGLLSASSEFFCNMFRVPQPTTPSGDEEFINGTAVIPFPDADEALLRNLLLFCNPPPLMDRLDEIERLADKYDMPRVQARILKEKVKDKINLVPFIMLSTIAQKTGQDTDAYFAAVFVILFPDARDSVLDSGLLQVKQVDALKKYHSDCAAAAKGVASPIHDHYHWMTERWTETTWFTGEHDDCCKRGGTIYMGDVSGKWMMRYWWRDYIYASREELKKWPCGRVVQQGELFDKAMKEGSMCSRCSRNLGPTFSDFASLFASEIDKKVSSVSLNMDLNDKA
ncbi:hypothetical protein CPB84DRAFT_1749026 [Gymnopilus junonius]|uniref:BTB domain-containing protein n=1 Tax=Gymnopilus junonius TaxID=109634 RepID=A0A9P5TL09_GYMJU|nr:hypothetical protein CPB84DRAFT_1749026 [Gymnopilus junonius]